MLGLDDETARVTGPLKPGEPIVALGAHLLHQGEAVRLAELSAAGIMTPEPAMSAGRFNLSALAVRERSVTLFDLILISVAGLVAFFGLGESRDPPFTVSK